MGTPVPEGYVEAVIKLKQTRDARKILEALEDQLTSRIRELVAGEYTAPDGTVVTVTKTRPRFNAKAAERLLEDADASSRELCIRTVSTNEVDQDALARYLPEVFAAACKPGTPSIRFGGGGGEG